MVVVADKAMDQQVQFSSAKMLKRLQLLMVRTIVKVGLLTLSKGAIEEVRNRMLMMLTIVTMMRTTMRKK